MNATRRICLAATLIATCAAVPTFAQGLLDEQLGPKAPTAAEPEKAADAAPSPKKNDPAKAPEAKPPVTAGNPDIISPEAAKKVDDEDLIRDLTQPGSNKPDPQKVEERVKAMLERMNDSTKMLKQKDPGDVTQETQRRIVMDLDVMIELAKQQQQQGGGQSQQPPQPGQERKPGQPQPSSGQGNGNGGNTAATGDDSKGGQSAATTGDLRNRDPANWGGLPPRDRDAISHGASEEYLAAYKSMIDRYYQALAEMGKSRNH